MPSWLFNINKDLKIKYLNAFCDGDGCIGPNRETHRHISSSKTMLIDMQSLAFSAGLFASLSQSREVGKISSFTKKQKNGNTIVKSYKTAGLLELNIVYDRKQSQYREDDNYYYVPVKNITEELYNDEVINFETKGINDSNHTYLVNNIVTHNCDGSLWHNSPELKQKDMQRDMKLASVGWRIIRLNEDAINENLGAIQDIIYKNVLEAANHAKSKHKKTASENEINQLETKYGMITY
jgi:hypothetical protein